MDAARLNFSHGSHKEYRKTIALVREAAASLGRPLAIMADLQGPKIRVGELPGKGIDLVRGRTISLSPKQSAAEDTIPVSYRALHEIVESGDRILMDDGKIILKVVSNNGGGAVACRVVKGGFLKSRKGINLPGKSIPVPSLTAKDKKDLDFALGAGVDYVALSFVRSPEDIVKLRRLISRRTKRPVRIIAKIEKREAIRNISGIIGAADAIMIARGDLGVEIAPERVPFWQKEIIRRAREQAKTVITATQMLESMIENPMPTRAEASDVANAVYDGTDCVMLSGETAAGRYPVAAVRTMNRIARTVEGSMLGKTSAHTSSGRSATRAICAAACQVADSLGASAIVTPTSSGATAYEVSRQRPKTPIMAISTNAETVNQLALAWGVSSRLVPPAVDTDNMFSQAIDMAKKGGLAKRGDRIVITAGVMVNVPGTTNLVKIHKIDR